MTKIKLGTVGITDKGTWKGDAAYSVNDIVHTSKGIYRCKVATSGVNPDNDTSNASWAVWVDKRDLDTATSSANTAASAANAAATNAAKASQEAVSSCKAAEASALDTASHPTKVGEDNYVYEWDKAAQQYVKTDIYVRGSTDYPTFEIDPTDMQLVMTTSTENDKDRFSIEDGVLCVNLN